MLIPFLQNHFVIRKGSRLLLDSHTTTASVMLTNGDNLKTNYYSFSEIWVVFIRKTNISRPDLQIG